MSDYWQAFTMRLLEIAIPILIPLAAAWIGRILTDIWSRIREARPDVADVLYMAAQTGVEAAEQVGLSGALTDLATSKLDYATDIAQRYLSSKGINKVDLKLLRGMIESAVKRADFPHTKTGSTQPPTASPGG
jgi:hypothetical protein